MKKTIFLLVIASMLMAGACIVGCLSSDKKVKNAEDKVQDANDKVAQANQELNQAIQDSIQQFRKESEVKFIAHEKNIADFKARIENEKKENKAIYEKKLAELEQKDTDLKKKLADYKEDSKDKWNAFKKEFNHDMDELGQAFKDLTVKNDK